MLSNDIAETNTSVNIDRSAQLNLVIDLQRLPQNLRPGTPDQHADMLRNERQEVVDDIAHQRKKTQADFAAGLILLVLSMGQFIALRLGKSARAQTQASSNALPHDVRSIDKRNLYRSAELHRRHQQVT